MGNQRNDTKEYIVDKRTSDDILEDIIEKSRGYIPEWKYNAQNMDIAATMGMLFSTQMADNVQRANQTIDRYRTEFINLLDIVAKPALPAETVLKMELAQDTISGVEIPKGTKFISGSLAVDDEVVTNVPDNAIFETQGDIYVTGSRISSIFMTDIDEGSVEPILGKVNVPHIIDDSSSTDDISDEDDFDEEESEEDFARVKPFVIFGENHDPSNNICLMYHPIIFKNKGNVIYVKFSGNQELIECIKSKQFEFVYPCAGKLIPVEDVKYLQEEDVFSLTKEKAGDLQQYKGKEYAVIALKSNVRINKLWAVEDIAISSRGEKQQADYIGTEDVELGLHRFEPFTSEIGYRNTCYIGHNNFFSQKGAIVLVEFDVHFEEKMIRLTAEQQEAELKIIRKKAGNVYNQNPANVYVNEVNFEYFNGIGWKKLPCKEDITGIFSDGKAKKVKVEFECPADWDTFQSGSFNGFLMRMVVLRADDCYMRPAVHHYPVIKNLFVSFDYTDGFKAPDLLSVVSGTKQQYITKELKSNEQISVFKPIEYNQDALYIGFDERPLEGPIGIFMKLQESQRYNPLAVSIEYSSHSGFKHLKVLDETENFSHSGMVYFVPPSDFARCQLEGNKCYWIRIVRGKSFVEKADTFPVVEDIMLNCVRVANIDTQENMEFYVSEIKAGMEIDLIHTNLLNADVWVNETAKLTNSQMNEMLRKDAENCRAEYDIQGNIVEFFVRWQEVDLFDEDAPFRSYILDRMESKLIFGDGITTDVPRELTSIAVKVTCRKSIGRLGNIEKNEISSSVRNILYLGSVYNPIKAYGGSSMENLESALRRGANIISTRKRIVSKKDYLVEVKSFSDLIDQADVILDTLPSGEHEDGATCICILMKDYNVGSYSFHRIENQLKEYILSCGDITLSQENLYIVEPIYVELSVVVWCDSIAVEDNFLVQNTLTKIMTEYLNPLQSKGSQWQLGVIPKIEQIRTRLSVLQSHAVIKNVSVLAKYNDANGHHEVGLEELQVSPFMIPVSGTHQIK